jgi:polar amino acid transport system substrate-binding protein
MSIRKSLLAIMLIMCVAFLGAEEKPIILVTFDYPPFMFIENKQAKGINVEIVDEIFKRIDAPHEIDFYTVTRCLKMIENYEADGMFSLKKTKEREKTMTFTSIPIVVQDYVFFKKKNTNFNFDGSIDSIKNLSIGVVQDTSYGPKFNENVKNGALKKIDSAISFELVMKKLMGDRTDIAIFSRVIGEALIKKMGYEGEIIQTGPPIEIVSSYFAFSNNSKNAVLVKLFDAELVKMKNDGTLKSIINYYDKKYYEMFDSHVK